MFRKLAIDDDHRKFILCNGFVIFNFVKIARVDVIFRFKGFQERFVF